MSRPSSVLGVVVKLETEVRLGTKIKEEIQHHNSTTTVADMEKGGTQGHFPQKFLRIVEISGLWKFIYFYSGKNLINYENFFLNSYLAYL